MRLIIEKFKIDQNAISDLQRKLLDSGSTNEKIKTASEIVSHNNGQNGNADVSKFSDIVSQAILRWGISSAGNPFLNFLNNLDNKIIEKLNSKIAQTVLDIIVDADSNLDEIFSKDIGIFEGSTSDIQYKLKVLKVFTNRQELRQYKNDKGQNLTLDTIMSKDKLKPTDQIRKILDNYFTSTTNKENKTKETKSLKDTLALEGIKVTDRNITEVKEFLVNKVIKDTSVQASLIDDKGNKISFNPDEIERQLVKLIDTDDTNKKIIKFLTETQVESPYKKVNILKSLINNLDESQGGTLISGSKLIAVYLERELSTLKFKDLIYYVIQLIDISKVPYIKSQAKDIKQQLKKGTYDTEFREVFNQRYKIASDTDEANKYELTRKRLNEAIARLLQSLFAADTSGEATI